MPDRDTGSRLHGTRALIATLACLAALFALTALRYAPPPPLAADTPPEVFSAARAQVELAAILGEGAPHPMGSTAHAAVRMRIIERLSALGYEVHTQTGFACHRASATCGMPVNILARLRGRSPEEGAAVLLAAHYDSVAAGPGAADDGAGVAAILEIARALQYGAPPRHDVIFLIDDGEEAGLLGARLFVDQHPWAARVKAAVNLEARGTSGPSFMFETGSANRSLIRLFADAIPAPMTNSLYYSVYKRLPNDTDFTVFKAAGYQGYNFAFLDEVAHYHTPDDTLAQLDPRSLQHEGYNALRIARALAENPLEALPTEDAVYVDVFRTALLQWPASLALPLALLLVAVFAATAAVLHRRRQMTKRQLIWGLAASLGAQLAGHLAVVGLFLVLRSTGIVPPPPATPWIAHPDPGTIAFAALAFAATAGLAILVGNRPGLGGAALGHALLVAALGVAAAAVLPGASFLFVLPGAVTAIALLALARCSPRRPETPPSVLDPIILGSLPAVASFAVLLPLLYFLYDALGTPAWPLVGGALLLGTPALAPLLVAASARARRTVFVAALLTALGGLTATALLPTYSADVPQRLNLEYRRDADHARAQWVARPDGRQLPPALAASFTESASPAPGGRREYLAPGPELDLAAPELQILDVHPVANGIRYHIRLLSPRGADELRLRFPSHAAVRALEWRGSGTRSTTPPPSLPLRDDEDGWHSVTFRTIPPEGVELAFESTGAAGLAPQLIDRSYGLPPQGRFLQQARNPLGVPSREGDTTTVMRSLSLPAVPIGGSG